MRESLDVNVWSKAEELKREIEDGNQQKEGVTINHALQSFIDDCTNRNLNRSTLLKYTRLHDHLATFARQENILDLAEFNADRIRKFRQGRALGARTAGKELERIKSFFRFCVGSGWLSESPAQSLKAPEFKPNPTLPFSEKDLAQIFAATEFRTSVFFRILLHSGLRIIDAAQLRPEKIIDGRVFLYTQKTGVPVMCPLPPDLLADLEKLSPVGGFFFAIESERPESIAEYYRVKLARIDKKFRPHRFRDTFATNLLLKGVSLENVAILLGNTVRVCEKHYAPWIKARQRALEKAVESTWSAGLVRVK